MTTRDTILVIDDDPDMAVLLRDALGAGDCRVLMATSVPAAVSILRAIRVDLVLADALRPASTADRWSTLDAIRDAAGDAPLILCTADDPQDYTDHTAHGGVAILAKPFDLAELAALISSLRPSVGRALAQRHGYAHHQLV